jgi:hypothetical protein
MYEDHFLRPILLKLTGIAYIGQSRIPLFYFFFKGTDKKVFFSGINVPFRTVHKVPPALLYLYRIVRKVPPAPVSLCLDNTSIAGTIFYKAQPPV